MNYGDVEVMEDEVFDSYTNEKRSDKETRDNFKKYILDSQTQPEGFEIKEYLSAFGENFKTWRVKQGKQNLTISFR
jgi:hypothetical protein